MKISDVDFSENTSNKKLPKGVTLLKGLNPTHMYIYGICSLHTLP